MIDSEAKYAKCEEYLKYVRSLSIQIQTKREQIEMQKDLCALSGVDFKERVSVQPTRDSIDNCIIKLEALITEFCTDMAEYVEAQHVASRCLSKLSKPEHRVALTKYYLTGKPWEQVCVDMSYTWQGMMSLRRRAIIELYDYMPEEWRSGRIPKAVD